MLQLPAQCEFALDDLSAQPVGLTFHLHFGAAGQALAAHVDRNADQALIAYQRRLAGRVVFQLVDQRNDARDREMQKIDVFAGLEHQQAAGQGHQLEVRQQALVVLGRKGGQDLVLLRVRMNGFSLGMGGHDGSFQYDGPGPACMCDGPHDFPPVRQVPNGCRTRGGHPESCEDHSLRS